MLKAYMAKGDIHPDVTNDKKVFFPAMDFSSLHSTRAGRATAAAVVGVPDRLFKKHGRWKSENAKDGYIEDSLEQRLSVTKKLGL